MTAGTKNKSWKWVPIVTYPQKVMLTPANNHATAVQGGVSKTRMSS